MAARQAAGSDAVAGVARSRQDLAGRVARLDAEIIRAAGRAGGPAAKLREEEAGVRRELEALDARIEREFPRYRELTNPRPLELAEAQKLLGEDEALVVFLFARREGFVWALRRNGSSLRRLALPEAEVEKRVEERCVCSSTSGVGFTGSRLMRRRRTGSIAISSAPWRVCSPAPGTSSWCRTGR